MTNRFYLSHDLLVCMNLSLETFSNEFLTCHGLGDFKLVTV